MVAVSVPPCHRTLSSLDERLSMCRANNLANINAIVAKYRGANVTQLWAQLAIKFLGVKAFLITWFILVHLDSYLFFPRYNVPPIDGVELLSRTLYQSSPFEYSQKELRTELEDTLAEAPEVDGVGKYTLVTLGFLKIVVYTVIPEADENYFNPSSIFMSSFWCLFSEVVRILSMPTCHLCHQVRREVLAKGLTPSRTELLGRALTRGAKDLSGFRKKALRFCDEMYELVEVHVIVVACKKRERNINFRFMICLKAFGTFFCSCSVIFTWFDVWFVSSII